MRGYVSNVGIGYRTYKDLKVRAILGPIPRERLDMGIFSKRAATILDVRLSNLDCDVTEQALSDSRNDLASLAEFLRERQLITTDDTYTIERARERVEATGVVRMMLETCDLINKIAGRTIVDVHSFFSPIPILCCFIFVEHGTEYFMRLEMQGTIPNLRGASLPGYRF